jgi:type IV secretion system protein VirB6
VHELNFYGILNAADTVIDTLLMSTYPKIAQSISPLVFVVVVLYWALFGMRIYTGHVGINWMALLNRVLLSVAAFSLLVWGTLAHHIYAFFVDFADGISAAMTNGKSASSLLETLWMSVASASAVLMGDQLLNTGIVLMGFGLFLLNAIFYAIIIACLAMAKFGLAATMLLLPVFFCFALFKLTRQWAMNWLGMMLYCSLLYFFLVAIVHVGFLMFEEPIKKIIGEMQHAGLGDLDIAKTTYVYLIEAIFILFVLQARVWAAKLSNNLCGKVSSMPQTHITSGGD